MLSGVQPSGEAHLGNYVGAIKPAIAASHTEGVSAYYFLADYHSLVKCDDPERVSHRELPSRETTTENIDR